MGRNAWWGDSEIRKCLGTSNLLNLMWFLDLKFLNMNALKNLRNFKSTT